MIDYSASLKATGGSRSGIAPANLLDILDVNGKLYYFSDRPAGAPPAITSSSAGGGISTPPVDAPPGQYVAWAYATNVGGTASGTGGYTYNPLNPTVGSVYITGTVAPFTAGDRGQSVVTWGNFAMPALPGGAVIQSIMPVVVTDLAVTDSVIFPPSGFTAEQFTDGGQVAGEAIFSGGDFASALAALEAYVGEFGLIYSLDGAVFSDYIDVNFFGLAIYYSIPGDGGGGGYGGTSGAEYSGSGIYKPWLLEVPKFSFYRSLQTSTGSFVIQNVSGDTLSRDMEKLLRASAFEGAFFIYRCWQPDAESSWIEVHGTLTVDPTAVDTLTLKSMALLNPSQDDTPLEIFCETCQIQWAGARCGSTQPTECSYSYQTCQVPERIMVALNDYEKNYGEAAANTALNVINRRRRI